MWCGICKEKGVSCMMRRSEGFGTRKLDEASRVSSDGSAIDTLTVQLSELIFKTPIILLHGFIQGVPIGKTFRLPTLDFSHRLNNSVINSHAQACM